MKNVYVKNIKKDLIQIFIDAGKKSKTQVSANTIELYEDKLVSEFLIALMKNKEIGCSVMYYMYKEIANLLNITNFYGRYFIKKL